MSFLQTLHPLRGIKGNPSLISDEEQIITYTNFKKIATVTEGSNHLTLTYCIDHQRRKGTFKTNGETTLTRYYLGDYEEELTANGKPGKFITLVEVMVYQPYTWRKMATANSTTRIPTTLVL